MKCAVIIGIVQMMAGLIISLGNYIYFKNWNAVWFRFVPEILFLACTFGYMAFMIVLKWLTTWDNTNLAPSLLETMTNFFLQPGTVQTPLYAGQAGVQVTLLLIAFAMVPILLGGVPYMESKAHKARLARRQERARLAGAAADEHESSDDDAGGHGHSGHGGEFDFSEIMIHQMIHTIEFVLGGVSNTASYLRLWALSLAHAQLSEVFWNFAFMLTVGMDDGSGVMTFIGFAIWLSATLGVLLMMESLSAFLHALRLHWMEFNGKFYSADGVAFTPFDLKATLGVTA
jgi:V-type H+-transporting ATPase subunit a